MNMLVLTVFLLVAIPLWVFWDDIDAARRGMTPIEYIDWKIAKLKKLIAKDKELQASRAVSRMALPPGTAVRLYLSLAAVAGGIGGEAFAYSAEFHGLRYVAAFGAGGAWLPLARRVNRIQSPQIKE